MKIYIPYYYTKVFQYTLKGYKTLEAAKNSIAKHLIDESGTSSIRYMILEIEVEEDEMA